MVGSELSSGRRVRRWRSVSEKRQIVQLTLEPGASVAEVARAHGVNATRYLSGEESSSEENLPIHARR